MFDADSIREDFPILHKHVHGRPLIYLDNAATTQLPIQVLKAVEEQFFEYNANVHRGIHYLSEQSTARLESSRETVQHFLNAEHAHEIVFTKGTTDSINIIAFSCGESFINENDEVIVSAMEHHSNLIPWQMTCKRRKAKLVIMPLNESGEIDLEEYAKLLTERTRLVAVTHISNVIGTVNPINKIIKIAHERDIPVLIDGAQSVLHDVIDVRKLDCDFFCFSGHKMLAPAGIGILYGKEKWLEQLPPAQFGGGMVDSVNLQNTTFAALPHKFEAGTPNCAGAIALKAAILYLNSLDRKAVKAYEYELLQYSYEVLSKIEDLKILGSPLNRTGVLSFIVDRVHPYDIATFLDKLGIAVRSGHHCAQTLLKHLGLNSTLRVSLALYNTKVEIDALGQSILQIRALLKK